jgi:hypothetical protein
VFPLNAVTVGLSSGCDSRFFFSQASRRDGDEQIGQEVVVDISAVL